MMGRRGTHVFLLAMVASFSVALSGCGGGGGSTGPVTGPLQPEEFPDLPQWQPVHAAQAPTIDYHDTLHIGANVASPADLLTAGVSYGGIATSSGWVQDGTAADRVIEFLEQHVSATTSEAGGGYTFTSPYTGLPTFSGPPTVRLAAGTSDEYAAYAVRAIQLINAALPYEQRIEFSSVRAPALAAIENIPNGEIFIDFAASEDNWNFATRDYRPGAAAVAENDPILEWDTGQQRWEVKGMRAAHVWFSLERIMNAAFVLNPDTGQYEETLFDMPVTDPEIRVYSEEDIFSIMVHELLHELGFLAHNDGERFNDSLMRDDSLLTTNTLPMIDGDALLAAYARLEPGTEPEELSVQSLGPWTDTSFHLRGDFEFPGGEAAFGVASRNGRAQPWASGTHAMDGADRQSGVVGKRDLERCAPGHYTVRRNRLRVHQSCHRAFDTYRATGLHRSGNPGGRTRSRAQWAGVRSGETVTSHTQSRCRATPSGKMVAMMARSPAHSWVLGTRRWAVCSNGLIWPRASAGCGSRGCMRFGYDD